MRRLHGLEETDTNVWRLYQNGIIPQDKRSPIPLYLSRC